MKGERTNIKHKVHLQSLINMYNENGYMLIKIVQKRNSTQYNYMIVSFTRVKTMKIIHWPKKRKKKRDFLPIVKQQTSTQIVKIKTMKNPEIIYIKHTCWKLKSPW